MDWEQIKAALSAATGLERDALHIYAAILIQLAVAAVTRRTVASPLPWLVVFILAVGNEGIDIHGDGLVEPWEPAAGLHDIVNTMILPSLILLVARFAPALLVRKPAAEVTSEGIASPDS